MGASSTFFTSFAIVVIAVFIGREMGWYESDVMWGILFLLFIILMLPSSYGFLTSERSSDLVDKGVADAEVTVKNANFKDSFLAWITGQEAKGSGEYIGNADTEQTHEFIGVKIEGIEPWKDQFYSTEPVYIDIDYSANSYFPITIMTGCKIDGIGYGKVDKPLAQVSKSQPTRVRCTFEHLPAGHHVVDFIAVYSFESTVRIPLKFMEKEFVNTLLTLSKDSGNDITPESYVGGTENPLTSSGPIAIGVSNAKRDGVNALQMPIELYKEDLNKASSRLRLQIQENDVTGGINRVENATFNLPKGMVLKNCDFLNNGGSLEDGYVENQDRWEFNVDSDFNNWGDLKTLSCEIGFKNTQDIKDYILPPQMRWSPQTIFFIMRYQYKLEQSISIEVVA